MFVWNNQLSRMFGVAFVLAGALVLTERPIQGAPSAPVMNAAVVNGPLVTLSWAASAGATSYRLAAGMSSGATIFSQNVGNVTSLQVNAPLGTFFVRVHAIDATGESVASNEITVAVTSLVAMPAAPTNLQVGLNGRTLLIGWTLGTGGGPVTTVVLVAGTTPGGSDLGSFPLGNVSQFTVPVAPVGTYHLRVYAQNAGGRSADSNEVAVTMPTGGGCTPPPAATLTASVFFNFVSFSWNASVGALGYRLDVSTTPGGPALASLTYGPTQTSVSFSNAPAGTFYGRLTTIMTCGAQTTGPDTTIVIDNSPPPGPRTPDPAPGQLLPLPGYGLSTVNQMAAAYPSDLQNSCREHGGHNHFMFKVLRELRRRDTRWGLNYKRGNFGDLSQDIISYNPTSSPDPSATRIYVIDIMGNHCGTGAVTPNWQDQTQPTWAAGARGECFNRDCALWAILPYLQAGYPISPTDRQ
jgi:hypothetical protein